MVVGAPLAGPDKKHYGAAYVFVRAEGGWALQAELVPSSRGQDDYFGYSVAIDKDTVVVGAPLGEFRGRSEEGAAYVFAGSDGAWSQQAILGAPSRTTGQALFGLSVDIDGDEIIIGSPGYGNTGAAFVFARSANTWALQATLRDQPQSEPHTITGYPDIGTAVSIQRGTAVVSIPSASEDTGNQIGAAWVFIRSNAGWEHQATLSPSAPIDRSRFGHTLALDNGRIVVGAPNAHRADGEEIGLAYVFQQSGASWRQVSVLEAIDGLDDDMFGSSVALGGDRLLVGAAQSDTDELENAGAVYVFSGGDNVWTLTGKLTAWDANGHEMFGTSVSLAGTEAIVGSGGAAVAEGSGGTSTAGSVRIIADVTKAPQPPAKIATPLLPLATNAPVFTEISQIKKPEGAPCCFGGPLAVSGDTVVVGAPEGDGKPESNGLVYVYVRDGDQWALQARLNGDGTEFGGYIDIDGDTIVAAASRSSAAVHIFVRTNGAWARQARLEPPTQRTVGSEKSIALSNDTLVVWWQGNYPVVYARNGVRWIRQADLIPAGHDPTGAFVARVVNVDISGETAVVGNRSVSAPGKPEFGAVHVFMRSGETWQQQEILTVSDRRSGDGCGALVTLSEDTLVVGCDLASKAYLFVRESAVWVQKGKFATGIFSAFPGSVAVSGEAILVGGSGPRSLLAYLYTATKGLWSHRATFVPSPLAEGIPLRVALSGRTALIGNPSAGVVYVFDITMSGPNPVATPATSASRTYRP